MASIKIGAIGSNRVELYIEGVDIAYEGVEYWLYDSSGNELGSVHVPYNESDITYRTTYYGLESNTSYRVSADVYYYGGTIESIISYVTFTTGSESGSGSSYSITVQTNPSNYRLQAWASCDYAANGDIVTLDAEITSGSEYEFSYWEASTYVEFENCYSPNTSFTMPNRAVTITAYFKERTSDTTWSIADHSIGTISNTYSNTFYVEARQLHRYSVSFQNSGIAQFYTSGDIDTIGYLTTTTTYDTNNGVPYNYLVWEDSNNNSENFLIEYEVSAGTTYYLWVRHGDPDGSGYFGLHIDPPASTEPTSVAKWDWYASNGNATADQTARAYSAIVKNMSISNFSYLVWNDMVDKVNAIIGALGSTWYDNYATYDETKISPPDKTLTAKKFNSLRFNIGSRYSTGIQDVKSGDLVYGWYFTTLAECINAWIDRDL